MTWDTEDTNNDHSEKLRHAIDECRTDDEIAAVDLAKFEAARDKVRRLVEKVVSQAWID